MTDAAATFVFKGTVEHVAAGHVSVRVDDIIEASGQLNELAGQTVDVHVGKSARLTAGDNRVFHTVPVSFGHTVVVRSMKEDKPAANELEEHLGEADLVVSGTVQSVRDAADQSGRITEHAPRWREALVDVSDVYKGRHAPGPITVRFPASTDVRWVDVPKLVADDAGVFLLHRAVGDTSGSQPMYEMIHPNDFQPRARTDLVKQYFARHKHS